MATLSTTPPEGSEPIDTGRLDGASGVRIVAVLAAIVLLAEIAAFQLVMVGAALQKMTATFPDVGADINWALIIPGIVGAAATPLFGKLSDLWGKKKIFLLCGVLFLIGALIDAVTASWTLFLIGRGLQGFSLATLVISYGLVRDLIPRKYIPIGLGVIAGGVGLSGLLGPIIAGVLVDNFQWRALFWFLVAYVAVMLVFFALTVPETKLRVRARIQPLGILLLSIGTFFILLYVQKGNDWGWISALGYLAAGIVLVVLFAVHETRSSDPIMDMKVLANPKVCLTLLFVLFGVGILAVQATAMGYMTQTPSPQQLTDTIVGKTVEQAQQLAGVTLPPSVVNVSFDPGYHYGSGFSLLSYALHLGIWAGVVSVVFGPIAGLLAQRIGARIPAIVACVIMAIVGVGFALATPHYSWQLFAGASAIFGIGFAFFYASAAILIVDALPEEQQGIGSGMLGVALSLGGAIGTAVMAAFQSANPVVAHIDALGRSAAQPIPQVFADRAYVHTFYAMAASVAVALVIALVMRHGRKPSTAGIVDEEPTG